MRKVALVFVLAVFVPSLVLAWLAVRSLRDQQFILERQRALLYQGVADAMAKEAGDYLADRQREFGQLVESLLVRTSLGRDPRSFDDCIRTNWPLAEVGFVVSLDGEILAPSPLGRPAERTFCADYSRFLANRESAEVFWNADNANANYDTAQANAQPPAGANAVHSGQMTAAQAASRLTGGYVVQKADPSMANLVTQVPAQPPIQAVTTNNSSVYLKKSSLAQSYRNVMPQQQGAFLSVNNVSKVAPAEAEFRQLIGDAPEGTVARFVENKLNVLFWHRSPLAPRLVFGAQVDLAKVKESLGGIVQHLDPALTNEIVPALLDDNTHPVALSCAGFEAPWKRPFVSTEIGEALPHWEMAIYLANPAQLQQSARTVELTLGLLIVVLLAAIAFGSWLIVLDLNRQLTLARQKTDFVSNVSHELKTPLTSIRMFSELLSQGRVAEPDKQRSYLAIITAEAARLTRLINNVLDFARLERGEKKYHRERCEFASLVAETVETYRPHLESIGFTLECDLPAEGVWVNGDRDALAQIVVNLLSNAEKYSGDKKEILVQVELRDGPPREAELRVLDRGLGVPAGCEERIFEQFFRAHDSLASGIQGSGLGLTLARQIARAHGGDVLHQRRPGGGSCFVLRLPALNES
jgi:signal transduction histidine kinase